MKRIVACFTIIACARILKDLRGIKTALEVEIMQKAMDITNETFRRLLQKIKPGIMEYEIEAEIYHSFLSQRATGPAYSSIIASGDRARVLHGVKIGGETQKRRDGFEGGLRRFFGRNEDFTRECVWCERI